MPHRRTDTSNHPQRKRPLLSQIKSCWQLYVILLLPMLWIIIFCYGPMYGIQIAFKSYSPSRGIWGSEWVGLQYFEQFFRSQISGQIIANTLILSFYSILASFPIPIMLAIAFNEMRHRRYQKFVQMVTYAPYFISTVVLVGMMIMMTDPRVGIINRILNVFGISSINFMGDPSLFRHVYVWSGVWQTAGYSSVIYIAALAGVPTDLHEAAMIDGASKIQRIWHIDLPGIKPTITIILLLNLGTIMNLGFEKVYLMQNALNTATSEIISTYVYKVGMQGANFGLSTAIGLFNSVVNMAILLIANFIAKKVGETQLMVRNRTRQRAIRSSMGDRIFTVIVYIFATICMVLVFYPLVFIVSASFSDARMVSSGRVWLWPVKPTLIAYEAIFKNPRIVISFLNSLFYMFAGTAINLFLTVLAAYALSRKNLVGRNIFTGLMMFTMLFNGGMIPTYLLMSDLNLLDTRLVMLLCSALSVWNVIVVRTYYQINIPEEMHEAATLDGCDEFRFLAKIAFPLSGPILAVMALYYGVGHWNSYFNAMLYIRDADLYPLQIVLRNILVLGNMDTSMVKDVDVLLRMQGLSDLLKYSVSVVSTVPLLILYPFVQKYFVKGVMVGAVKG